jgi:nitrate reductase alpha subunit
VNDARITKQSIMDMFYRNVILAPFYAGCRGGQGGSVLKVRAGLAHYVTSEVLKKNCT